MEKVWESFIVFTIDKRQGWIHEVWLSSERSSCVHTHTNMFAERSWPKNECVFLCHLSYYPCSASLLTHSVFESYTNVLYTVFVENCWVVLSCSWVSYGKNVKTTQHFLESFLEKVQQWVTISIFQYSLANAREN